MDLERLSAIWEKQRRGDRLSEEEKQIIADAGKEILGEEAAIEALTRNTSWSTFRRLASEWSRRLKTSKASFRKVRRSEPPEGGSGTAP